MRRFLFFLPFALVGCKAGRQVTITNAGLVASTAEGGTFVAGKGRVAPPAESLAFAPDEKRLAVATENGILLWPSGKRIADMKAPFAWSPDGESLAGLVRRHVVVHNLATGKRRTVPFIGTPTGLHWTADGRLLAFRGQRIDLEGGRPFEGKNIDLIDARVSPNGGFSFLAWDTSSNPTERALRYGYWSPIVGESSNPPVSLSDSAPKGCAVLPLRSVLAPGGRRFAVAVLQIQIPPENLKRIKALVGKAYPTRVESRELERRTKGAWKACVVLLIDGFGQRSVVWHAPTQEDWPTDLAFSPDERWLAIGLKDRTVRVEIARSSVLHPPAPST